MKPYPSPKCPDQPWSTPCHLFNECWSSFPAVLLPKCDIDHSLPSSADVNERSYTSTPYMHLLFMDMKHIFVMLITNTDGSTLYDITLPTNNYFMLKRELY